MIFFKGKEITQIVLNNKQINLLNKNEKEISLQQKLDNYSYDKGVPLNGDKTLRSVPVDLCCLFTVLDEEGPGGEDSPIVWLEDEENNTTNIKINENGSELEYYKKETTEKEIYPGQTRTCVDVYETIINSSLLKKITLDYGKKYWLYGYDTYEDFLNKENLKTYGSIKTKNKQSLPPSRTIYINNYPQTAEEFKKTNYCTIQQAFRELEGKEGTYTIELAKTNIPYQGLLYYKGKANIIIKGNGQTISAENCGVLNNDEHKRSCFEWAGNGNIVLQNVKLKNTYTREEYGEENSAGETFGMTSGNVIAIGSTFTGWQDTIRLVGHGYFENCVIEGDTDFIWAESGFEAACFENCTINCKADYYMESPNSCIVAPRMLASKIVGKGLVFRNCSINIEDRCKTYLGRNPWSEYTEWYNNASFINCNINSATEDSTGSTCMYDLVNKTNSYFRTSMWKNAATSFGDQSKVGYKTYNLTLNNNPLNTNIIKKTSTYTYSTLVNEKETAVKRYQFYISIQGDNSTTTSYTNNERSHNYSFRGIYNGIYNSSLDFEDVEHKFYFSVVLLHGPHSIIEQYYSKVDSTVLSSLINDGYGETIVSPSVATSIEEVYNALKTVLNGLANKGTIYQRGGALRSANYIKDIYEKKVYGKFKYMILDNGTRGYYWDNNGTAVPSVDYCNYINKWFSPMLLIRRKKGFVRNDKWFIPLTGGSFNKAKTFEYSSSFTTNDNYVDENDGTDSDTEEEVVSYEAYTASGETFPNTTVSNTTLSTTTQESVDGSGNKVVTTIKKVRTKTTVRDLIDYKMENCPELTEEEVNTEFTGPNNILNRVYDDVNKKYTTSPIKWTDYEDYIDYTDDSDCGSDDNIKAWVFGVNAFSDTYQFGGTTNGTIENNNGDKLTVDCSEASTAKVSSEGRANDIQMNVGAKILIPTNSGDTVIVNCYPGYKASLSGGTTSQTIEQVSSGGSLVLTVDSNSYIMSIYIIGKS